MFILFDPLFIIESFFHSIAISFTPSFYSYQNTFFLTKNNARKSLRISVNFNSDDTPIQTQSISIRTALLYKRSSASQIKIVVFLKNNVNFYAKFEELAWFKLSKVLNIINTMMILLSFKSNRAAELRVLTHFDRIKS